MFSSILARSDFQPIALKALQSCPWQVGPTTSLLPCRDQLNPEPHWACWRHPAVLKGRNLIWGLRSSLFNTFISKSQKCDKFCHSCHCIFFTSGCIVKILAQPIQAKVAMWDPRYPKMHIDFFWWPLHNRWTTPSIQLLVILGWFHRLIGILLVL